MAKEAEARIKDLDDLIENKKREVQNINVSTPEQRAFSWGFYKFFVKHEIGVKKGLVLAFIIFIVFITLVLVNNFYLKIFF